MKRVTSLGGVFFRADDPQKLYAWYEKHLGIKANADGTGAIFEWRDAANPEIKGMTVWSIFPRVYWGLRRAKSHENDSESNAE